jgi:hypothetical protein
VLFSRPFPFSGSLIPLLPGARATPEMH